MERTRILVNSPSVVSEVIEGEAVIMNLGTGQYFSCQGVGGEMWSLIEQGATRDEILGNIMAHYAVEESALTSSFDQFLASLEEHDLVRHEPDTASGDDAAAAADAPATKSPFVEPLLNVYNDMEDLLLLDPIHDVDETGWPQPKPAEEGAVGGAPAGGAPAGGAPAGGPPAGGAPAGGAQGGAA